MTPTVSPSLSSKIRDAVAAEQEEKAAEAARVDHVAAMVAQPVRGKDRRKANVGAFGARVAKRRRVGKIAKRSAARNRR